MVYQFFGLNLISDYPFTGRLSIMFDKPDPDSFSSAIFFTCDQFPPFPVNWDSGKLIYYYRYSTANGELWDKLYDFGAYAVWRFAWGADFYIRDKQVDCHLRNSTYQSLVEQSLVGAILAFWLEREGFPAMHASAVVANGQVAAFLSQSGNGKSTLAAAFLQAGAALFTDDILPLEQQAGKFWGRPGLPQINLWPDQATYFLDSYQKFEAASPDVPKQRVPVEAIKDGAFCHERRHLACIYIPNRSGQLSSGTKIEIRAVPPAEAVIELVRYSFIPPVIFERLGWQARRLEFLARLVKQVPVRRLTYPAGFEHLPRVTEAVLQDLKRFPSR